MTTYNKTLCLLASKLGLEGEEKVLSKAAELERLLQTKTIAGSNITDTSKIVICLDLAANINNVDFDVKTAIKYSGLKQPTYLNTRKIVENLLELTSDKLTISALCLTLQCTKVQALAEKILEQYKKHAKLELDLNLPQYVCMAVFHACRISKEKVSKSKLIEKSRLKPAQWAKLDGEWSKFVDEKFATIVKKKRDRSAKVNVDNDDVEKMELDISKKEESTEPQIEPYEDWKRRILEEAYKELKKLEQTAKVKMSPRKSPRKTPQKNSPYKTNIKGNGVRLLFPKQDSARM